MSDKLLENVDKPGLALVPPASATDETKVLEKKVPAGCVERVLNFKDRFLILEAVSSHLTQTQKSDLKSLSRFLKLRAELHGDEVDAYFEMMEEAYRDKMVAWKRDMDHYLGKNGDRPDQQKAPQPTKEEHRGKARAFYLPSKLDALCIEAIEAMKWNPVLAEYVVDLGTKFGIKSEE